MFVMYDRDSELYHHGILGMHWGIRRFQPYPKGHKGGKEIGEAAKAGKRRLSPEAEKRKQMRSEAATLKAKTELDKARADAAKAQKALKRKAPKLSKEAKKRAKERARISNLEKEAELKRREVAAIKAKEDADRAASDSRRLAKVAAENERTMAAQAKTARIQAEQAARTAKKEARDRAHSEIWTPFHTKSGKNRAIASGDPDKINKYASRMTPQELQRALDAYRVKQATGKLRVKKSLLDKATFKTYRAKDKAITSGDPKKVKKYAHLMTSDEYKTAIDRCSYATDLQLQNIKKVTAYGESIAKGMESFSKIATNAISIHDSIATVYNATNKSGKTWKKWVEQDNSAAKQKSAIEKQHFINTWGYDPITLEPVKPRQRIGSKPSFEIDYGTKKKFKVKKR